ncbi:MAG: glutamate-5-semialdehyde dehydrogenase [Myxococcota bacterium]
MPDVNLDETVLRELAQAARDASRPLARSTAATRTQALEILADKLGQRQKDVLSANLTDIEGGRAAGLSKAMVDRLDLQGPRFEGLIQSVRAIAEQKDPIGEITQRYKRPNGLEVQRRRLPLGVILMIYESRPNVTIDAASLCIRSANAVILRGGSEALQTNRVLCEIARDALRTVGLPEDAIQLVPTQDHQAIDILLTLGGYIDLVIPRGGEALIRRVTAISRIPVVQHYKGICHIYVDDTADITAAIDIVDNAKSQRPGVCNALETLLVSDKIAKAFLPRCIDRLLDSSVEVRGCQATQALHPKVRAASAEDWDTEFLDLTLAIKVVSGVDDAVSHIDQHGTGHTAAILTQNQAVADDFVNRVDVSCVLVNASTRFNDGGELGLGAEMGMSTTRIHAYGPIADALTAERFVVLGNNHVRR